MLVTWTPRRTDRSAINLRRFNANKEDAVEPPVPSAERLVVLLRIHGTATIRSLLVAVSPFSDMKISDSPEARPNSQSPIANSQLSFGLSQTSWLLVIGYADELQASPQSLSAPSTLSHSPDVGVLSLEPGHILPNIEPQRSPPVPRPGY